MTPSPLTNRSVLVTGGTGSFGTAFVRHALEVGARRVVVLSRDELKQHEMRAALSDDRLRFFIGSVTDANRCAAAMRGVDYVVHAAAMKQIPTCEDNPWEAIETNVIGTRNVAMAAIGTGVTRAVFLSTDKAAQPNTHYGACKLAAERLWTQANVYAAGTETRLCATRYGNVIGSRGSVIPLFQKQAAAGEVLTITDERCSRFWMRIEEAVALVELALAESRGGEVFVPQVPSCGILTTAEASCVGSSKGWGWSWTETGIRPGEKLHETLISEDEARQTYDHGTHYRIEPDRTWTDDLPTWLKGLKIVDSNWSYRSDTNPWQLSVEEMRALIQPMEEVA